MSTTPLAPVVQRTPPRVLLLCFACLIFEGYDVIAYGATLPFLLAEPGWGLTLGLAGALGSLTPVGMLVGAGCAGVLTDRLGRRRMILASTAAFSVGMLVCGLAPGTGAFAAGRLMVGLGAGGILPSAAALVFEYSAPSRRNINNALACAGIGVGSALAALMTAWFAPTYGFRVVFLAGSVAGLVVLVAATRLLPESLVLLRVRGRADEGVRWAQRLGLDPALATAGPDEPERSRYGRLALLFSPPFRTVTLLFSAATFVSLLVLFGIYTWLPQLMRSAGYDLGSALTFLAVLGAGTAVGPLLVGRIADRVGSSLTTAASFLLAVVGISLLSLPLPSALLYAAVVLAGVGTVGTQILLNVFIAGRYPVHVRASAIGVALAAGRVGGILGPLYGSLLLAARLPTTAVFLAFAAPAVVGAILVMLVPTRSGLRISHRSRSHRSHRRSTNDARH